MADTKITGLTALTTPAAADLIAVVDDVVGTPTTKKVALSDLLTSYIEANISIQEANISDLGTYLTDIVSDTTPQLGGQLDVNGNAIGDGTRELLTFTEDASAVNHINIENEATGAGPIISAAGDDTNIDLILNGKGSGNISLGNFTFDADQTVGAGQDNYVLTYDNATGLISLEASAGGGGGLADVVDDTTPQLGGNLDVNGNKIVSVSNGNIDIEPNGTGNVLLGNFVFDADQTVGAGQDNYVLTYDNGTGLISLEASAGGGGGGAFTADGDGLISATSAPVLDAATGNETAYTFAYTTNKATSGNDTGFLINQTDTASPGTSLLIDAQVGGTSQFKVDNSGRITLGGGFNYRVLDVATATGVSPRLADRGTDCLGWSGAVGGTGVSGALAHAYALTSNAMNSGGSHVIKHGGNENTWIIGATNGQTLSIFNTSDNDASPTNYERLSMGWASNIFDIGPESGGTGVVRPMRFGMYGEKVNAIGSIGGGTQDIDLRLGNVVTGTVDTSTTTFTFSNPIATGSAHSFTLILTNGGSQTVNWPASVDWAGGTGPTLTAAGVDVITFTTVDGGTTWYGFPAGINMS